jgi:hypothetical protein
MRERCVTPVTQVTAFVLHRHGAAAGVHMLLYCRPCTFAGNKPITVTKAIWHPAKRDFLGVYSLKPFSGNESRQHSQQRPIDTRPQ